MEQKDQHAPVPDDIAHIDNTEYEVGQDNVQVMGMDIHNPVFVMSTIVIFAFVIGSLLFTADAQSMMEASKKWTIHNFDWLFMVAGNVFVLFCLTLIVSPLGSIRLGGKDATPDFSRISWLAMLFAAGMGIGLMFWSVAEPVAYYTGWYGTPLNVDARTPEAAQAAMGATMFHWGIHPWAIYGTVAVALAFFSFNRGLPLSIRSAFYPLFGDRVWGWVGHIIDLFAVFATLFGLATSLGFGAQQAASGLSFLFGVENAMPTQLAIIFGVTMFAVLSVVRGLDGGVKILSNINMLLALLLLVFVAVVGLGLGLFASIGDTVVAYASHILPLSNWIGREDDTFYEGWTVFYWAWWISWSPFVGMFIARVSKGRTIREFMTAVLIVPTLVTIIWMTVFGGNALEQVQEGVGALAKGLGEVPLAMFQMLEHLSFNEITSIVAIVLVLVFFVTSSDSGSLVIDSITSGGKLDAPVPQRIYWAVTEGVVAAVLLYGGGKEALKALQAGAITTGLPFVLILLALCFSTLKGLMEERRWHKM
jgi:betaine/carnitine transporter, BCCT family